MALVKLINRPTIQSLHSGQFGAISAEEYID